MLRWVKVNALSIRMAADSTLLLGLVEEFVSGQQDTKATETAKGSVRPSDRGLPVVVGRDCLAGNRVCCHHM